MNNAISDIEGSPETQENELGGAGSDATKALTLYEQLAEEWKLELEEQKILVRSDGKIPITRSMMIAIVKASKRYAVPISGFNVIPAGKGGGYNLYLNADGIRFRLLADERGFKSSIPTIEHMPTDDEPWIITKTKIEMQDGTISEDYGVGEWPPQGRDHTMKMGDYIMKLITKSSRRAGIRLVGASLPMFDEDWREWAAKEESREIIEGKYEEIEAPKKTEPTNLAELIDMVKQYDIDYEDLPAIMGVPNLSDLNIKETWDKIRSTDEATVPGQESET